MSRHGLSFVIALVLTAAGANASGQPLATLQWQLSPFCNVVTLAVTASGGVYTLDGDDDQCGASTRAAAVGTAFPNPDGSLGLGLTIVVSPSGLPVHVQAIVSAVSGVGPWTDSTGQHGTLVAVTGGPVAGLPRPAPVFAVADGSVTSLALAPGAVDAAAIRDGVVAGVDVDADAVQRRVRDDCPAGQFLTAVNRDGTVACAAFQATTNGDVTAVVAGAGLLGGGITGQVTVAVDPSSVQVRVGSACQSGEALREILSDGRPVCAVEQVGGDGDITDVIAGVGLSGGGASGAVSLSMILAGTGAAAAARADHAHAGLGAGNTFVGAGALTADLGTTDNTAVGSSVLASPLGHLSNTAIGASALSVTTGSFNTAVGSEASSANTLGARNVAVGRGTHASNTVGADNVAIGEGALDGASAGDRNIGIGWLAGNVPTTGSDSVFVKSLGTSSDGATIRIGDSLVTRAFVSGIYGKATALNDAVGVVVDGAGQLGTIVSSRRFKEAIAPLGDVVSLIQRLRPVSFRYLASSDTQTMPVEFGLIAEEVAVESPELTAFDDAGRAISVKYHVLPAILVEEVRRLERERAALVERIRLLEAALSVGPAVR